MPKTRKWELEGPRQARFSLPELAAYLGYEDAASIRRLVAEGRLPAPRGHGANQYYTGSDVAVIDEMMGRWQPAERPPAKASESAQKRAKASEDAQERES